MQYIELSKNELIQTNGGNIKEAAFLMVYYGFKYSSLTGALVTGITEGYYMQKAKRWIQLSCSDLLAGQYSLTLKKERVIIGCFFPGGVIFALLFKIFDYNFFY